MSLKNWSTTAASNNSTPPNGAPEGMALSEVNNTMRQIMADVRTLAANDTIAASSTTDIGSKDATFLTLTGTATTITGLGTVSPGIHKFVVYNAAHTVTHNATTLILVGGASRTVAAGNVSMFVSEVAGWRELFFSGSSAYQPVDALLTAIAGQTTAANRVQGYSGVDTVTLYTVGSASGNIPLMVAGSTATETLAGLVEKSTSAENIAGTANTVYPSVAGVKEMIGAHISSAKSLAPNGYVTLANGLILQWGQTGSITNGSGKTVTLPIAFPTAGFVGFVIGNTTGSGAESNHAVTALSTTTLTFTNSSATTQTFYWFAIGY